MVKVPLQGSNMSVVEPGFYSSRFLRFLLETVFVGPSVMDVPIDGDGDVDVDTS